MTFKELHHQDKPLLIANVWDVPSTKATSALHFKALGTSSAAIAHLLGYEDGEQLPFSELEYIVRRIAVHTNLPLSVDLESGYSRDPKVIVSHIKRLAQLGVVGINIEDSIVVGGIRTLLNAEDFARTLTVIKDTLEKEKIDIFLNVRIDTFILLEKEVLEETKRRIKLYERAGAHGIFTPCIVKEEDIKAIVKSTELPLNVMCMPNLPDFNTLADLGVKRISMGNFIYDTMYTHFEETIKTILAQDSFNSIF